MSIKETGKKKGPMKDRLLLGICGRPKRGKTHLALTSPPPQFVFNLDHGLSEVMPKFDKELYYEDYLVPSKASDERKLEVLDRFEKDFFSTVHEEDEGTIIIDTFTQVWDLVYSTEIESIRESRDGEEVYAFDYSDANSVAENLIQTVKETNLNLVVTERMTQVYNEQGNSIPGKYKAKGYKGLPYLVQVFGRIRTEGNRRYYEIQENRMSSDIGESKKIYDPTFESIKKVAVDMELED